MLAYLNQLGEIFRISDAEIFGKVESMLGDAAHSASPKIGSNL